MFHKSNCEYGNIFITATYFLFVVSRKCKLNLKSVAVPSITVNPSFIVILLSIVVCESHVCILLWQGKYVAVTLHHKANTNTTDKGKFCLSLMLILLTWSNYYDDAYVSSWATLVITVIAWTQYQLCSAVSAGWRHAHIIDCIAIPISIHTLPILIFTGFWLVEAFGFQRSVYKHCRFYNYYVSTLVCKSFCLEGTCLELSCFQSVIWRLEDKSCAVLIVAHIYLPFSLA